VNDHDDVVEAEIVDDRQGGGVLALVDEPPPLVDFNTVLFPGQELPTAADGPQYSDRDLYVSAETAALLQETDPTETGPLVAFTAWCTTGGRELFRPCTIPSTGPRFSAAQ
jgi:hypothetical protein